MKKNQKLNEKGITLVALVVTIIVLLILAGVSINLVFDADGLFSKANQAASKYNQSKDEEEQYLSNAVNTMDKYFNKYGEPTTPPEDPYMKENTKVYENGEDGPYYWIPEGFKEADDSPDTIKEGKVVEDKKGNQFVWIPAYVPGGEISSEECATELKTTNFGDNYYGEDGDELPSDYAETQDSNDINSVKEFGGYFQGRFEAGNDGRNNVIIKKNQVPYANISMDETITKANGFATATGYNTQSMYSKLVSGYAWDCSLAFIAKSYPNYPTNSGEGGHGLYDAQHFQNTGLTVPVCNIYDMGGNIWERTSEKYYYDVDTDDYEYVDRGGGYSLSPTERPAASRAHYDGDPYENYGFRVTLYLK